VEDLYEISTDPGRVQLDVVHGFLSTCYWSPGVRRDLIEKAIANSVVVGAYQKSSGVHVGFARAVTDRASFAWLCDVFVLEPHRGHGLATQMVRALIEHPELQTLRRWCLATRDAHGVYEPLGFVPVQPGRWMEMRLPEERWKASGQ
jgi:GNAT superfamily N-acetyltransferase